MKACAYEMCIFYLKIRHNVFGGETPLEIIGELTVLPRGPLAGWKKRVKDGRELGGKGGSGMRGEGGEGVKGKKVEGGTPPLRNHATAREYLCPSHHP